ncbi:MAG: TIGR02328 family protein [Pediococcus acidilactici]|jgi:uncharacterized protein (TIGR02328 family)|nr:TIGR02328 family protein [Pediococcus acidilactici]
MRLWHEKLISKLPRAQLLGQHREVAALRGKGWGKKHATVDYIFTHSPYKLYQFHLLVMAEMQVRGYHPDPKWFDPTYRGLHCPAYLALTPCPLTDPIYPEHDQQYLAECLENLRSKGIQILI